MNPKIRPTASSHAVMLRGSCNLASLLFRCFYKFSDVPFYYYYYCVHRDELIYLYLRKLLFEADTNVYIFCEVLTAAPLFRVV